MNTPQRKLKLLDIIAKPFNLLIVNKYKRKPFNFAYPRKKKKRLFDTLLFWNLLITPSIKLSLSIFPNITGASAKNKEDYLKHIDKINFSNSGINLRLLARG
ncbi:hypothetical protein C2G38_2236257 [Gigaspora rosea]|uniref:Uncharacterized protein n=1 Tax=Gigaspora rosea TaxID=44941 RepID=A0A397TXT0_9GLOM|nr:hypothetical protein C2G38_2236257 [Gigaspora rosea]